MHLLRISAGTGWPLAVASPELISWAPLLAAMVMLMQAGFGLLETGLGRAKNAAHTMSMNVLVYVLSMTGFFVCGYALMCGGIGSETACPVTGPSDAAITANRLVALNLGSHAWGIFGFKGFFLGSIAHSGPSAGWYLLMAVFMSIAVSIPSGANIERWKIKSFVVFSLVAGGIIFPLYACWVWGGGWLAQLGVNAHLGHGAVDYSGSAVIQLFGGCLAVTASIAIGPRLGKYDETGAPRPIFGHNVPMIILGTLIMAFGWFALNCGRSIAAGDGQSGIIGMNTALASIAGALGATIYMWSRYGKPDPSVMCNGLLAGLVSSSAGCAFFSPFIAFMVGGIAGVLAVVSVLYLERRGIDDPVGTISVHGINGIWGTLALGLFANGSFGDGYNGVAGPVTGLFYGGGIAQLVCQFIMVIVCIAHVLGAGLLTLMIIARFEGGTNRVTPEVEIAGLDIPEMGAPGYPEFISHVGPEQVPSSQISSSR
jgi:Amt family ammonium transporter